MLQALAAALKNYFTLATDPREIDAASMTLHDCLRLIYPPQPSYKAEPPRRSAAAPSLSAPLLSGPSLDVLSLPVQS
jgi:hypothetical protein